MLGIAVLGSVFSGSGSYLSGPAFVAGLQPALWVGVGSWPPARCWSTARARRAAATPVEAAAGDRRGGSLSAP